MRLPGGILAEGVRLREIAFRPLTGMVELALAEAANAGSSMPARVTAALVATLENVGGAPPQPEVVAGLSVADRQFLMGRLAMGLGVGESWFTACCSLCGERFDFDVNYRDLPVKEAGEGYPFCDVETSLGPRRFRVPSGADQELIAELDDEAAFSCLLDRCLISLPGQEPAGGSNRDMVGSFSADDFERIEAALEEVAAQVAVAAQADCPDCGAPNLIEVDPYRILNSGFGEEILRETHVIASIYHWSEAEIMALPRERRRRYLQLIDRARGMLP